MENSVQSPNKKNLFLQVFKDPAPLEWKESLLTLELLKSKPQVGTPKKYMLQTPFGVCLFSNKIFVTTVISQKKFSMPIIKVFSFM